MTEETIVFKAVDEVLDTLRFYREQEMMTVSDETLNEMKQTLAGTVIRAIRKARE